MILFKKSIYLIGKLANMRLGSIIIWTIAIVTTSCGYSCHDVEGYELEEFVFLDKKCDSISRNYVRYVASNEDFTDCLVMECNYTDGEYVYLLSHHNKDKVMSYFIQHCNKRVIGYVDYDGQQIILLTDMDDILSFKKYFKNILKPLPRSRRFGFICHQTFLCYNEQNVEDNCWSYLELVYDPLFFVYKNKNGVWSLPVITTNPYN